jgi:hypothetical protein
MAEVKMIAHIITVGKMTKNKMTVAKISWQNYCRINIRAK